MMGIYEYSGIQRCGKSTLMMRDLVEKILPAGYRSEDVYANFRIFLEGVHCLSNEAMVEAILRLKRDRARDKVLLFDEVGQELKARSYGDKLQTEVVSFAWQMPKRGILLLYCSNVGNSADIILRDATWVTVMPRYVHGVTRDEDYIKASVIFNYDCRVMRGVKVTGVARYQELFDSWEPIE